MLTVLMAILHDGHNMGQRTQQSGIVTLPATLSRGEEVLQDLKSFHVAKILQCVSDILRYPVMGLCHTRSWDMRT